MSFYDWMSSTPGLAISVAVIGVVSAIGAQIVAAVFTAKREKGRLAAEQERLELTRADDRARLFRDDKRLLYTEFVLQVNAILEQYQHDIGLAFVGPLQDVRDQSRLGVLIADMALLAGEEVTSRQRTLSVHFMPQLNVPVDEQPERMAWLAKAHSLRRELIGAMRTELGVPADLPEGSGAISESRNES